MRLSWENGNTVPKSHGASFFSLPKQLTNSEYWCIIVFIKLGGYDYCVPDSFVQMKQVNPMKVCLVGSSGGHLTHLYMLKPFWSEQERFWVTFDKEDARSLLEGEQVYPCYFPTNRNVKNLIRNTALAWKVLRKEKPDLIISTGAAVAVPFFYLGKLFGAKTIYIEVFDRIDKPTLTGRLVYPITDRFVVQWEEMKQVYPKAINWGSIF